MPTCKSADIHTLERHVLQKVRRTVGACRLRARTSVNPRTDGGSLRRGVRLSSDRQAVGEHSHLCQGLAYMLEFAFPKTR